jgi:hypothetical protein
VRFGFAPKFQDHDVSCVDGLALNLTVHESPTEIDHLKSATGAGAGVGFGVGFGVGLGVGRGVDFEGFLIGLGLAVGFGVASGDGLRSGLGEMADSPPPGELVGRPPRTASVGLGDGLPTTAT